MHVCMCTGVRVLVYAYVYWCIYVGACVSLCKSFCITVYIHCACMCATTCVSLVYHCVCHLVSPHICITVCVLKCVCHCACHCVSCVCRLIHPFHRSISYAAREADHEGAPVTSGTRNSTKVVETWTAPGHRPSCHRNHLE